MKSEKNEYMLVSAMADVLLNTVAVCIAYFTVFYKKGNEVSKMSVVFAGIVVILSVFVYAFLDVYSTNRYQKVSKLIFRIVLAQSFLTFLSVITAIIFSKDVKFYVWILISAAISLALITVKKVLTVKILHFIRIKNKNPKNIVIVGTGDGAKEYYKQIKDNLHFGHNIIGYVGKKGKITFLNHIGEYENLGEILDNYKPDEVILSLSGGEEDMMQDMVSLCDRYGIRVSIIPGIYKYFKNERQVDMIGNLPVINTRAIPLDSFVNAFIKRLTDIVFSLVLICITLPIMFFAIIGVRLSSKGPVIFKQKRVGKNNKEFTMYKFRSMKVNDSEDTGWTTASDPRKTRFGTFMRKTGIDELPQLFNVLFGSMSIVGPRPELPMYVKEYSKKIPLYMVKHQVKPGITGLAQIYGYRGDTSIEKRVELDIKYIEGWTPITDIKIILITPFKMFNRNEKYIK